MSDNNEDTEEQSAELGCVTCHKLLEVLTKATGADVEPDAVLSTVEIIIKHNLELQNQIQVMTQRFDALKLAHKQLSQLL